MAVQNSYTGLTNIALSYVNSGADQATFMVTTPAVSAVVTNYLPADCVVIPASATGTANIIMESSPDLVNWTAASPGQYSAASGSTRFFRVRAALQ